VCVCVFVCVRARERVSHCVRLGATVTLYTYNEWVEDVILGKKET